MTLDRYIGAIDRRSAISREPSSKSQRDGVTSVGQHSDHNVVDLTYKSHSATPRHGHSDPDTRIMAKRRLSSGSDISLPRKRSKPKQGAINNNTTDLQDSYSGDSQEYAVKSILQEKRNKYLIAWEGGNPETGEPWSPTWEPKSNANELAVIDWQERQQRAKATPKRRGRPRKSATPATQTPQRGRQRKSIISGTSPVSEIQDSHSQTASGPGNRPPSPLVQVTRDGNFHQSQYINYSSPLPTQATSLQQHDTDSAIGSSPAEHLQETRPPSSFVIPDSQSQRNTSSYIPVSSNSETNAISASNYGGLSQPFQYLGSGTELVAGQTQRFQTPLYAVYSDPIEDSSIAEKIQAPNLPLKHQRGLEYSDQRTKTTEVAVAIENETDNNIQSVEGFATQVDNFYTSNCVELDLDAAFNQAAPITSQIPDTLTRARPSTPSNSNNMADFPSPNIESSNSTPIGDKLKRMREMVRARYNSGMDTTTSSTSLTAPKNVDQPRSPSQPSGSRIENSTVSRISDNHRLQSHLPASPSRLAFHSEVSQPMDSQTSEQSEQKPFPRPLLGEMEFIVPLPMDPRIQDEYKNYIIRNMTAIQRFCLGDTSQDTDTTPIYSLTATMVDMIDHLQNILSHRDLDDEGTQTQDRDLDSVTATWAEFCSSKFKFLSSFFKEAKDQSLNVALIASPGRLLDIIETYLRGKRVDYSRPDNPRRPDSAKDPGLLATSEPHPHVTLLPTGMNIPTEAELIIAFDSSFDPDAPSIKDIRRPSANSQLYPIIRLLIANSYEHFDVCLSKSMDKTQRLRELVSRTALSRQRVGLLPDDAPTPQQAGLKVAEFMASGGSRMNWSIPEIEMLNSNSVETATQPDSMDNSVESTQSGTEQILSIGLKRPLDPEIAERDVSSAKKPRSSSADADVTHISDSAKDLSSQIEDLRTGLKESEQRLADAKNKHADQVLNMEQTIKASETRLEEHIVSLSKLQQRFEEQNVELAKLRGEKTRFTNDMKNATKRIDAQNIEISKLKDERSALRSELQASRDLLKTSTAPPVAELAKLQDEVKMLRTEKDSLSRRLRNLQTDFDFTRQQYQTASTAAAEESTQLLALQAENTQLQEKARGVAVRLREMNIENENSVHLARVEELEDQNAELEGMLRRRDEEIREMRKGRGVQTRGSTPRSPRILGKESRGNSPANASVNGGRGTRDRHL